MTEHFQNTLPKNMSSLSLLGGVPGQPDATSIGAGGELEGQLTPWLGPPNQFAPLNLDIEGKNPHITHNLPLAFWGKSKVMESLIEFRITQKNDWYTSELMPWKKSEQINFSWMVFKYDKSFFEVEPYGGNPNYIQSGVEAYSDKMIQRGMAFTIAHGFWQTEMGQQQYRMNIEVLESSAQLTIYHLIVMSLLRAKNVYRNWELRFKNPVTTIPQALKKMKLRWAILNKGMHLFRQFHADLVEVMQSRGVNPTIWGLPPKSKILMSHTHESEYDYDKAGPIATNVRRKGQGAYDEIRGVKVYETTVFNEVMFGQMYNPLRRIREYGSFFWITNYHQSAHLNTYTNEDRFAAKILDASKDGQETKVSGKPLFRLSQKFDADGNLSSAHTQIIQDNVRDDLRRRLNDHPQNNYLDMFIGFDPSRDSQNPHHVMSYLGEMWDIDVGKHHLRDFSTTACNKLSCLTRDEMCAIDDADRFMDDLNNVDFNNKDHLAYWRAVVASGFLPGGENAPSRVNSGLFKDNGDGCINPPIVGDILSIKVNNVVTPVIFSSTGHVSTGENIKAATYVQLTGTHGLPKLVKADGTGDAAGVTGATFAQNLKTMMDGAVPLKFDGDSANLLSVYTPPLGFGHPTGLKTLANMSRRKEYRGYKEPLIDEAAMHYTVMSKFNGVWKNIFPDNELGKASACPYYFKSGLNKNDEITAFGLNLYNHARFPVFAVAPAAVGQSVNFGAVGKQADAVETEVLKTADAGDAEGILGKIVQDGYKKWKGAAAVPGPMVHQIKTRLETFVKTTDSGEVRAALTDKNTPSRLALNYRNKPFIKDGKNFAMEEFLAFVTVGDGNFGLGDEKASRVLTTVLEILLRDGSSEPVNWSAEIGTASERPVKIRSLTPFGAGVEKPVSNNINPDTRKVFNTRLCINPDVFRKIAEQATGLDGAAVGDALALKALFEIPVRPMNIFNPSQPLALYKVGGVLADDGPSHKTALSELRFASAPQGSNTVSSLTTSPFFASHLDKLSNFSAAPLKRGAPEDLYGSAGAGVKKRLVGGVLMTPNMEMSHVDSNTQTARLFGGIPVSTTTYQTDKKAPYMSYLDPEAHGTVPANIALSEAFNVFSFDTVHHDIAGGIYKTRQFRPTLVERFHEWAGETNNCHRIFAQSWITSKIKRQTFEAFWDQDVIPLVSFELWRIRQRYYMGSGFLAEGGDRLGNSFHGFHDFQWTDDIIRKVHVGHYTFLFAAPVKDHKMFALCEDIVAMGSISGTFILHVLSNKSQEKMSPLSRTLMISTCFALTQTMLQAVF